MDDFTLAVNQLGTEWNERLHLGREPTGTEWNERLHLGREPTGT